MRRCRMRPSAAWPSATPWLQSAHDRPFHASSRCAFVLTDPASRPTLARVVALLAALRDKSRQAVHRRVVTRLGDFRADLMVMGIVILALSAWIIQQSEMARINQLQAELQQSDLRYHDIQTQVALYPTSAPSWRVIAGERGEGVQFFSPIGIVADQNGTLYIADAGTHLINRLTADGRGLGTFGGWGDGPGVRQPVRIGHRFSREHLRR